MNVQVLYLVHQVATADQPFFSSFGGILESWEIKKEASTTHTCRGFFGVAEELFFLGNCQIVEIRWTQCPKNIAGFLDYFLFSSLTSSQIWLSLLVVDGQTTYLTKFSKRREKHLYY